MDSSMTQPAQPPADVSPPGPTESPCDPGRAATDGECPEDKSGIPRSLGKIFRLDNQVWMARSSFLVFPHGCLTPGLQDLYFGSTAAVRRRARRILMDDEPGDRGDAVIAFFRWLAGAIADIAVDDLVHVDGAKLAAKLDTIARALEADEGGLVRADDIRLAARLADIAAPLAEMDESGTMKVDAARLAAAAEENGVVAGKGVMAEVSDTLYEPGLLSSGQMVAKLLRHLRGHARLAIEAAARHNRQREHGKPMEAPVIFNPIGILMEIEEAIDLVRESIHCRRRKAAASARRQARRAKATGSAATGSAGGQAQPQDPRGGDAG